MRLFLLTAGIGYMLWAVQAVFSERNGMLNRKQMLENGVHCGVNFDDHGSTWWVAGALIPLMSLLVALYAAQWNDIAWLFGGAAGFLVSGAMHYLYTQSPHPDFMVKEEREEKSLSGAGWAHFLLFAGVIAVLVMTFFFTKGANKLLLYATAVYMIWHVFVGNHQLRKLNPPQGFPPGNFLDPEPWYAIAGTAVAMGVGLWYSLRFAV